MVLKVDGRLLGRARPRVRMLLTVLAVLGLMVWLPPVAQAAAGAGSVATARPVAPGWYIFGGEGGFHSYSGIASGMDSFSSTASGTFTSTPASSGGSGSGGSGYSGGGGGGGGGSW